MNDLAKAIVKNLLCKDPRIDSRIESGIEANRKGFAEIKLLDAEGKPVEKAEISYRQLSHEYRFGCNLFMLDQFRNPEKDARYRELFASLFNLAVVPFYWSDLEPQDGKPRFEKDSAFIYRRPPPDLCLEYCERRGITPKGHLLCWHGFIPAWAPLEKRAYEDRLERRIAELAERYSARIKIWDVANEAVDFWNPLIHHALPDNYVETAFRIARKYFPEATELLYNEGPWASWNNFHGEYTPLYTLVRLLLLLGLPVRGLGLQYHMYDEPQAMLKWDWEFANQRAILANLDQYAKLGLPVNISEISIAGMKEFGDGEEFQKLTLERLYKIWFSHPATNGIIYWNLVDGTAAYGKPDSEEGENRFHAGLLNYDLSPKPAFQTLERLIKKDWSSSGSMLYDDGRKNLLHGFYGNYEASVKTEQGCFKRNFKLSKEAGLGACVAIKL